MIIINLLIFIILYRIKEKKRLLLQHTNIPLTSKIIKENYRDLSKMCIFFNKLFRKLNIRYVIGHGSLIEIERNSVIPYDNDIDIRIHNNDLQKLINYGKTCVKVGDRFYDPDNKDIFYENRIINKKNILNNGVQSFLITNKNIHVDIVPMNVKVKEIWIDYDIAFHKKLRKKKYKDADNIYVPSKKIAHKLLNQEYGFFYKPIKEVIITKNKYYYSNNILPYLSFKFKDIFKY
tara:strand:+ start:121 stop:822 length:702 start_codon:yes stop_codon:yes gene_type:complete